jgi:hypothetical protein
LRTNHLHSSRRCLTNLGLKARLKFCSPWLLFTTDGLGAAGIITENTEGAEFVEVLAV